MAQQVKIFVSSPGDVGAERARLERVLEELSSAFDGVDLIAYRWEKGQYFTARETFQKQIPDTSEFDLVIGIVWSRIGSALPDSYPKMEGGRPYASGTAFEILTAIEYSKAHKTPDVLFYQKKGGLAVPDGPEARARLEADLQGLEQFMAEWFVNPKDGFKAAFQTFDTTDDFADQVRTHVRKWLEDRDLTGRERRWRVEDRGSPYAGLEAFGRDRADVFFGRGPDIWRCRDLLDAGTARFLLIEGASGSGKSSLARAGLIPDLLRPRSGQAERRAITVVPGAAPFTALARALLAEGGLPELAALGFADVNDLAECLAGEAALPPLTAALDRMAAAIQVADNRETPPATELILLIDQFEQLFARELEAGLRTKFIALLDKLARAGRVAVIITLRADVGGAARGLPVFANLVNDGRTLTVTVPRPAGLEEIVRGPADAAGLAFEQRGETTLDEVILQDARDADALPLLQFALARLFDAAEKTPAVSDAVTEGEPTKAPIAVLGFDAYTAMGGLQGALRQTAETAFNALSPGAQASLPLVIRALTGAGYDGALEPREADWPSVATGQGSAELAGALVEARILVRDGDRVRFAHQEVLSAWPRAKAAAETQAKFIRVRDDVAAEARRWQTDGRKAGRLMTGVRLAEALEVTAEAPEVLAEHRDFVRRSRARARRVQTLTGVAAALFLAVAAGAGWYYVQAERNAVIAEENAAEAERQRQAAIDRAADLAEALDRLEVQTALAIENAEKAEQAAKEARANAQEAENQRNQAQQSAEVARAAQQLAEEREADAEAARAEAEDALRTATEAANTLIFDLAQAFKRRGLPSDLTRQILEEVRSLQDSLAENFPDDLRLQRSRAVALSETGDMLELQGDGAGAMVAYEEALEIARRLAATDPGNTDWQRDVLVSLNKIGDMRLRAGDAPGALEAYEESLELARRLAAIDSSNTGLQRDVMVSLNKIGDVRLSAGDNASAQAAFEEGLEIARSLAATDPGNTEWQRDVSVSLNWIGNLRLRAGDAPGALTADEEALEIARRLAATDPGNTLWQRDVSVSLGKIGDVRLRQGNVDGAMAAFQEDLAIARRLAAADPSNTQWQRDVSVSLNTIGDVRLRAGETESALAAYEEGLEIRRRLAATDPGNTEWQRDLIVSNVKIARADPTQAVARYEEALRIARALEESGRLASDDAWIPGAVEEWLAEARRAQGAQ
ncbi:MAG: tetratricopeptide repeat protein [Pseudomonadota bacterium]